MSASKAGPAMWTYHNDFYQMDMIFAVEYTDDYLESMQSLRDYRREIELEMQLAQFEDWQSDPGFEEEE
jgi:hypothetical protein